MNSKIYNGNVQPNPKEFKIWVDDEGTIKTWNGTEWIESASSGGSGSGSSDDKVIYYEVVDGTVTDSEVYYRIKEVAASIKVLLQNGSYVFGEQWASDGAGWNDVNYLKAFAFMPIGVDMVYDNETNHINFSDFETFCQYTGTALESMVKRRITAEEYWERFNDE